MAKDLDLDLEVLEVGSAYTMYAAALVNLAIDKKQGSDATSTLQTVSKYAERLKEALVRCRVDVEIPVNVGGPEDILRFLQNGDLMHKISNQLVREHSARQEGIFLLTSLIGGALTASTGGVPKTAGPARSEAIVVGRKVGIPDSVIERCLKKETLTPLRDFLRKREARSPTKMVLQHPLIAWALGVVGAVVAGTILYLFGFN